MSKPKTFKEEHIPAGEKAPRLVAEDVDESQQQIEEAAYYIGLSRQSGSKTGDELTDWFEAERAVKENLQ
jgi:hypothetical protein